MADGITTIQISADLRKELAKLKMYDKESYEEVIWDLIEDSVELSDEAKADLKKAEEDVRKGRVYTLDQVKKELGI
jgi:predicted transcriptional regulator